MANDWLTYLVVIVLAFFVVSGVQLFLKYFRVKEVTFKLPFPEIKFEPNPKASLPDSKPLVIIINLSSTFILSFIIWVSINSFFPRSTLLNINNPTTQLSTLDTDSTQISKADGMIQMYVPTGAFSMGSDMGSSDERPIHTVILNAFWIDKFEVTNAMYAICVRVGKCLLPKNVESVTRSSYYGNTQFDNYPVISVTWEDANVYCRWAGRRLPTEAEWERAARGIDGRVYPWGNAPPDKDKSNFNFNVGDTIGVGRYPNGMSPFGVLDMAGNVWEWVNDWYDEKYYNDSSANNNPRGPTSGQYRVLRGGAWNSQDIMIRVSYRGKNVPTYFSSLSIGFRCAASP